MKRILPYIIGGVVSLLILSAGVAIGAFKGMEWGMFYSFSEESFISEAVSDIVFNQSILEDLDSGNIEDAKTTLNSQIDGAILSLGLIVDEVEESKTHQGALRYLKKVAEYRSKHPSKHKSEEIDKRIKKILRNATENGESKTPNK